MNKICVFFGTGFEEIEALTVVDILRRQKIETEMVSVMGQKEVMGSHGILIPTDALLEDIDFSEVDGIVLPGGLAGTKNLEACEPLMEQVDAFAESGKRHLCRSVHFGTQRHSEGKKSHFLSGL